MTAFASSGRRWTDISWHIHHRNLFRKSGDITLPQTNIAPENRVPPPQKKKLIFQPLIFRTFCCWFQRMLYYQPRWCTIFCRGNPSKLPATFAACLISPTWVIWWRLTIEGLFESSRTSPYPFQIPRVCGFKTDPKMLIPNNQKHSTSSFVPTPETNKISQHKDYLMMKQ